MPEREKQAKRYLSDLMDMEWELACPFLPASPQRACRKAWRDATTAQAKIDSMMTAIKTAL